VFCFDFDWIKIVSNDLIRPGLMKNIITHAYTVIVKFVNDYNWLTII
jgi:hypothetical protein